MCENYICYNNKFYNSKDPIFTTNRAIKYGDGLFESIRVCNGEVRFLDLHLQRMQKGLNFLKIDFSPYIWNEIKTCIEQLLIKNEVENGGKVRLSCFRAGGGKYTPNSNKLEYFIESEKLESNSYLLNSSGLKIDLSKKNMLYSTIYSGHKTMNCLPYILASIELKETNFDDLVLLNQQDEIVECTSSNIFLVKDNCVLTPQLESGCLPGIMRRVVISKLIENQIQVKESSIKVVDLNDANEIFITNAIVGVQWVGSYKSKRYFNKTAKKIVEIIG